MTRHALPALSFALLVAVWAALARLVPQGVVSSPGATAVTLWSDLRDPAFWPHVGITLSRVALGFALAMLLGVGVGIALGLRPSLERAFGAWLTVALTVPALCYAIVAFMVLGLSEAATVTAIGVTTFPSVAINVIQGVRALDPSLGEMAEVYGLPARVRLRRVLWPQIAPYVVAAGRFGLGNAWKIALFVELLGRSSGVGYMLYYWFQLYQMNQVFAWTAAFTLVMIGIEMALFRPLERRLFRWRARAAAH